MLGGMGDLKEHIDDEITDAVNEIISNICGSICTTVNAQGFPDVSSIKYEGLGSSIKDCKEVNNASRKYIFDLTLDGEKLPVYISFDEVIVPYLAQITGGDSNDFIVNDSASVSSTPVSTPSNVGAVQMGISSLLSEESAQNLQLLFDIKLKLSVRLGTKKTFYLKIFLDGILVKLLNLNKW